MWVAFVDESGDLGFRADSIGTSPIYALTAVIVHDDYLYGLEKGVREIWRKSFLLSLHNVEFAEIHMSEIIHGNKNYKGVPKEERLEFLENLFNFVAGFPSIRVISVVMNKQSILQSMNRDRAFSSWKEREQLKYLKKHTRIKAYMLLLERLTKFLTKQIEAKGHPEYLLLVVDSNPVNDSGVRADIVAEVERGVFTSQMKGAKYILLPPLFVESYRHVGIQLADVFGYVISKKLRHDRFGARYNKGFDFERYYSQVIKIIDKSPDGRVQGFGLKEWWGRV